MSSTSHHHPHRWRELAVAAGVSGTVVAGAILSYQKLKREHNTKKLKHSIPTPGEEKDDEKFELNEYGLASPGGATTPRYGFGGDGAGGQKLSKEDQRSAELAERAMRGDYDEGK
jgi:hypothetical protein